MKDVDDKRAHDLLDDVSNHLFRVCLNVMSR